MKPCIAYFGTSEFAEIILDELEAAGFMPDCIVTREDKPAGRHLTLTPPPVKIWAESRGVPVLQPKKLDSEFHSQLTAKSCDLFIIASYGKIIPQSILDIPKHKTLNVHPSLLPKLRGPSPIQSAILSENETGVSIMRIDSEMDHGPILKQTQYEHTEWPPYADTLEIDLAHQGGKLLAECIMPWVQGELKECEQDHDKATYCHFIKKEDANINLEDSPELNLRKIRAYVGWPNAWTIMNTKHGPMRVVIKKAHIENGVLIITEVIPEGRKVMDYEEFKRGYL